MVLADHHSLERVEIFDSQNLLDELVMSFVVRGKLACSVEVLALDANLSDEFAQKFVDHFNEILDTQAQNRSDRNASTHF